MLKLGCHLSSSAGYLAMGKQAVSIGANVFQFFTRNPRGGAAKALDMQDVERFNAYAQEHRLGPIMAHAPYTLNGASAREDLRHFAMDTLADDLHRLEHTPGSLYNLHPGSHVKQGVEIGRDFIIAMLNEAMWPEQQTCVLLETMAGKGSEIGRNFQELQDIIAGCRVDNKLGVCLDTCHIWDYGYDVVDELEQVLFEFDRIIGLSRLKAIHINDSLNLKGSHKDRHAKIGEGKIGLEALVRVINHPSLRGLPFYLETPNDIEGYAREIKLLREHYVD